MLYGKAVSVIYKYTTLDVSIFPRQTTGTNGPTLDPSLNVYA